MLSYLPILGIFCHQKHDLVYPSLDDFVDVNESASKSIVERPIVKTNEPKTTRKEDGASIIKDWVSKSEEEDVPKIKAVEMFNKTIFAKINFVKSTKQVKYPRNTSVDKNRQNTPSPSENKRNWNQQMSQKLGNDFEMFNKACHVCGSFEHLRKDCNNWYKNQRFEKPIWTNVQRVNKQNFSKLTHPSPKRNMVPRTVLTRSGPISLIGARPVNTVQPRTAVNNVGPMKNVINNAYSTARRPFNKITAANNSNFNKRVNTVNDKNVNAARPNAVVNTARPKAVLSGNPQQDLKDKGVIDSGCSRHMTGNRSYLTDYEEIDGGFVAFGGNSKGGKITRKGLPSKLFGINQTCVACQRESNTELLGIKREFSVARTPQQTRVAERKNKTLIEAARTMLADSKLPTTFYAEAVNTACYVQNKVLVIKRHSKTPYELFLCRKPALNFIRPFECPVTIPNTIYHLGKAIIETIPGKDYILLPLSIQDPPFSSSSKDTPDAGFKPSGEEEKKNTEDPGIKSGNPTEGKDNEVLSTQEQRINQEKVDNINNTNNINTASDGNITNNVNAVSSTVNAADDAEDVSAEADMNNLDTFMPVSPIPTTRIHKDHSVDQIIRDLNSTPQTRIMTKNLKEHDDIIFGSIKKSLCTDFEKMTHKKFQMSSMGELTFFLGLQVKQKEDGIFISQDKYVTEILNKFSFSDVKTSSIPMETHKPLLKDADGEDVNEHLYRSMIGSLMYLTSSRPNIMFTYPKDSPFDLVAYTDSDYTGASLDRKSTIRVKNPVFHSKIKHIEIRHHFIRDSNEKKLIQMIKIHTDQNVTDLFIKAFDVSRFEYLIASIRMLNL
ncbi:putative ribonuclease H-like domain-containing protein [Tanacetum coccineum]